MGPMDAHIAVVSKLEERIAELEKKLEFAGAVEAGDNALINGLRAENKRLQERFRVIRKYTDTLRSDELPDEVVIALHGQAALEDVL